LTDRDTIPFVYVQDVINNAIAMPILVSRGVHLQTILLSFAPNQARVQRRLREIIKWRMTYA
jgi:hypothetical protein